MFEIYEDSAGEWRWRLKAGNGLVVGDSAEGYATQDNARRAAMRARRIAREGAIRDAR